MKKLLITLMALVTHSMLSMAITYEYVDLGLPSGTLWATTNIGASTPEAYGNYYAWGETTTKTTFTWTNYTLCNGSESTCLNLGDSITGTKYDTATKVMGSGWCLPSPDQFVELMKKCTIYTVTVNGVSCFKFVGPSGKSITMPFPGYKYDSKHDYKGTQGYYWSSKRDIYKNVTYKAAAMCLAKSSGASTTAMRRRTGMSVRAVRSKGTTPGGDQPSVNPQWADMNLSGRWATFNLGATKPSEKGDYYAWGETSPKSDFTWKNYVYASGTASSVVNIGNNICGTKYDPVKAKWGNNWRMPTQSEIDELITKCTWVVKTVDGVKGYEVTSKYGGSIFLPFTGYKYDGKTVGVGTEAYYWSGNISSDNSRAKTLYIKSGANSTNGDRARRTGLAIRPVFDDGEPYTPYTTEDPPIAETDFEDWVNNAERVDLGLSVCWATCNLGADSESELGEMIAWGENEPKSTYTWANYEYANGTATTVKDIGSEISGTQYDVVSINQTQSVGDVWRMPTKAELQELKTKCTWTQTTKNGVKGYNVKGPNGNSIFLPFGGYSYDGKTVGVGTEGYYWSGTLDTNNQRAVSLYIKSGASTTISNRARRTGVLIRPVWVPDQLIEPVTTEIVSSDLQLPYTIWARSNYQGSYEYDYGDFYAWGEREPKSDYTWKNYKYCSGTATSVKNIGKEISETNYDPVFYDDTNGGESVSMSNWHMPSKGEIDELLEYCVAKQEKSGNKAGIRFYSVYGGSMFIPFAGYKYDGKYTGNGTLAYMWTGTLDSNNQKAKILSLKSTGASVSVANRRTGAPIRPCRLNWYPALMQEYNLVDLGLSVDWADCNVGAEQPWEMGDYVSWGENFTKSDYTWANYIYCNGTESSMISIGTDIKETDHDHAAYPEIGVNTNIRMPTHAEIKELISKCKVTATTKNGVKGYTFKGPSGNSIFLPLAGGKYDGKTVGVGSTAYYWSSTLTSDVSKAYSLYLSGTKGTVYSGRRRTGAVIRGVGSSAWSNPGTFDGIENVTVQSPSDGDVYTISGMKVDANNLKPGIYVRNGKKFVVK